MRRRTSAAASAPRYGGDTAERRTRGLSGEEQHIGGAAVRRVLLRQSGEERRTVTAEGRGRSTLAELLSAVFSCGEERRVVLRRCAARWRSRVGSFSFSFNSILS